MGSTILSKSIKNRLEPGIFRSEHLSDQVRRELSNIAEVNVIASNTRTVISFSEFRLGEGLAYEGDLVLCAVRSATGAYDQVEDWDGNLIKVSQKDLIVGVLSNRESSRFLVGHVPESGIEIGYGTKLDLLARGGNIGICDSFPEHIGAPLKLTALGVLQHEGDNANISANAVKADSNVANVPMIIVIGTSAECGKTTVSSGMIGNLIQRHGIKVAAAKISGTGRLGDTLRMYDAGGAPAIDFVDAGLPSTYTSSAAVVRGAKNVIGFIEKSRPDLTIAEFGGDVIWGGVPAVLEDSQVCSRVIAAVVCSDNATAAYGSVKYLLDVLGYDVPTFISGPISDTEIGRKRLGVTGIEPFNALKNDELDRLTDKVHKLVRA